MNKKDYIGYDLAKHLQKKGFRAENEYFCYTISCPSARASSKINYAHKDEELGLLPVNTIYPIYSYYQIITELAEELFGKKEINWGDKANIAHKTLECYTEFGAEIGFNEKACFYHSTEILRMLQQNKPRKEIDKYILNNLTDKYK